MTKQEKVNLLDLSSKIFNSHKIEERRKVKIHINAQVIRTIESNKQTAKRAYEKQIREMTEWQNNLYETLKRDLEEVKNETTNRKL